VADEFVMTSRVILASRSPRRKDILEKLNLSFVIDPPDIDESPIKNESPIIYVQRISAGKADLVAQRHDQQCIVIAADTTVELNGEIFGQPRDLDEARIMIQKLSSKTHQVHTAISVRYNQEIANSVDTASVTMREVTSELLEWYIGTGESIGKAGAYAVQGHGAALVADLTGEIGTVIGLPVGLLIGMLGNLGIDPKTL
jgi:septum formation protein